MLKHYDYIYEDCYLILFESNEILHIEHIEELELVEDFIFECQETGLLPCVNINRIER